MMGKMRKLAVSTLGLMVISGGGLLYAAAGKGDLSVYLNNVLQKQPGLTVEAEAYLPLEQLTESMQAIVSRDESAGTVRIYKPNVNTVLLDDQGKIFGKVRSASSSTFYALVQVDHLRAEISDLKITITDPSGKTDTVDNQQITEKKESFWFKSAAYTSSFTEKGNYTIQVYMKDTVSKKWFIVSELQISTT
ncbi:hypothetical protein [Paenibacillus sp. MMS20-IR301]|uniref:hypothetical protein n=1 Tax=Paenibacillus sp. MMS20-IR301 TaxID=2895946 RepID=UPI0028EFC0CF|nr:hypothetical protein [Paenibacillus sp. MMS20-IR301]WNS41306.1 hypothetical protein LOS79_19970 [Paenibacillus sp. MMS20-IR301]